jgi:hypothetical protein
MLLAPQPKRSPRCLLPPPVAMMTRLPRQAQSWLS